MSTFVAGADFMCALGIQIVIVGIFRQLDLKKLVNAIFCDFTFLTFFMVLSDGAANILLYLNNDLTYTFSLVSNIMLNLAFMVFFFYTWVVLGRKKKTLPIMPILCGAINALNIVFSVKVPGHNIFILLILNILILQLYLSFNNHYFSNIFLYTYFFYSIMLIISMSCELIFGSVYNISHMVFALINILMFLLIQITSLRQRETDHNITEKILYTDSLTNVNNRQAYMKFIDEIEKSDTLVSFYCDVNGLKQANSKGGNQAGDALLVRFANILLKIFNPENVFRISGDEFVILLRNCDEKLARSYYLRLQTSIISNENIACFGYFRGSGENPIDVIVRSENEMRDAKKNYYERI